MNGLYEIVPGGEADGIRIFGVTLEAGHAIFKGHFPGNPVLPGICSLMIIRECASRITGTSLRYASVKESKFLSAITPGDGLTVKLRLREEGGDYPVDATICSGDTTMLKLKAVLTYDE